MTMAIIPATGPLGWVWKISAMSATLEDDVYVHQAIADDGVAEAKRNEHQAERGELHPGLRGSVEDVRQNVKHGERQTARQSSTSEPLQLLA
jgi:hypothetical protein